MEESKISVEVLVAAMGQNDYELLDIMNIQTDAIIGNQCERNEIENFIYKKQKIRYLSFNEKGVGLNRNNTLMRATADICIVADDDIVFVDGYAEKIKKHFKDNPKVDVIIFNLIEKSKKRYIIEKKLKISYHNYMKFGATRIAFRRRSITKAGITFNLHFGGGAEYSAGEDTLFIHDCLKAKLKILAVPDYIATLSENRDSSWFKGYTDKFFIDRGALFASISKRWAWLLCLQFSIRRRKKFNENKAWYETFRLMIRGVKLIKSK